MEDEWVLITGSSKGLGRELGIVFAEKGFNVILNGRVQRDLENVREEILMRGVECEIIFGDLREKTTIEKLFQASIKKNINILINNAGIDSELKFNEIKLEDIEKIIEVNFLSVIRLCHKFYPFFVNRKKGFILNINAMDGLRNIRGKVGYTSSKHGLRGLTDSLRYEGKNYGVNVVGVYLSGMKTGMYEKTGRDIQGAMEPREVAEIIFNSCFGFKKNSAVVDDIVINRKNIHGINHQ